MSYNQKRAYGLKTYSPALNRLLLAYSKIAPSELM